MKSRILWVAFGLMFFASASFAKSPAAKAPPATPQLLEKGKASFTTNCVTCHGEKGDGNGPAGKFMNPKPRDFSAGKFKGGEKPEQIFKTLTSGLTGTAMPGFGHLPEEERWALVHHVLSMKGKK